MRTSNTPMAGTDAESRGTGAFEIDLQIFLALLVFLAMRFLAACTFLAGILSFNEGAELLVSTSEKVSQQSILAEEVHSYRHIKLGVYIG